MRDKSASDSKPSKKVIMVVDEDISIVSAIRQILQDIGYLVAGYTSPVLALRDFDANPEWYQVVISSTRLPQMTALGFVMNLKRVESAINIVLISEHQMTAEQLQSYPIVEILTKPLSAAKLIGAIEMCMSANGQSLEQTPIAK